MLINEFRAWLDGFSASFTDGVPNAEQWSKILERLATVQPEMRGSWTQMGTQMSNQEAQLLGAYNRAS